MGGLEYIERFSSLRSEELQLAIANHVEDGTPGELRMDDLLHSAFLISKIRGDLDDAQRYLVALRRHWGWKFKKIKDRYWSKIYGLMGYRYIYLCHIAELRTLQGKQEKAERAFRLLKIDQAQKEDFEVLAFACGGLRHQLLRAFAGDHSELRMRQLQRLQESVRSLSQDGPYRAYTRRLSEGRGAPIHPSIPLLIGSYMSPSGEVNLSNKAAHSIAEWVMNAKDRQLGSMRERKGVRNSRIRVNGVDVSSVATQLPTNCCFLEFFSCAAVNLKEPVYAGSELIWCAIIKRVSEGHFFSLIPLGPKEEVFPHIKKLRNAKYQRKHLPSQLDKLGRKIYSSANGWSAVFCSADDLLHYIPFVALATGAPKQQWIDAGPVIMVESAARLASNYHPEYRLESGFSTTAVSAETAGPGRGPYRKLKKARVEARNVARSWGGKELHLDGGIGGAQAFKDLILSHGRAQLVHFSGHGDFVERYRLRRRNSIWQRLWFDHHWHRILDDTTVGRRAFLVFGGFNRWLSTGAGTFEDVAVSAHDLSQMPLWSLSVLYLSACHAASGAQQRFEALASIATGARAGGAGTVVASISSVEDRAAHALARDFHDVMSHTYSASVSLWIAQRRARQRALSLDEWATFCLWSDPSDLENCPRELDLANSV